MISYDLSPLMDALPSEFDFYHLGEVKLCEETLELNPQLCNPILFRIEGEVKAFLIILFPQELDSSTYSEMGNVLASRLVTHLSSHRQYQAFISPPQPLTQAQFDRMTLGRIDIIKRSYSHALKDSTVVLQTWLIPPQLEGYGYA